LFPEYNTNSNGDVNPDRDINMSGWYLWESNTNQNKKI
jgi:hypothetical protein